MGSVSNQLARKLPPIYMTKLFSKLAVVQPFQKCVQYCSRKTPATTMTSLRAWYRDDVEGNLQELHQTNPPRFLTASEIFQKSGLRYQRVENCDKAEQQARLLKEGGYKHHDFLDVTPESLPDYHKKLSTFYAEHLHMDDEIRLFIAGSGFFEIRDYDDRWMRLHLRKGDLINLPAGLYHRFTLDKENYVKMMRLFSEVSEWISIERPEGNTHPARLRYLLKKPGKTSLPA